MMDAETIKFITDQNRELKEDLKDIIVVNGTVIRGKIESEIDRIHEMDEIRNGRICIAEEKIEKISNETVIARWVNRNKRTALIIFMLSVFALAFGYHAINFKRTVEKIMKVELND